MKGTETKGVKIFNYIRENSSENFLRVVPSATKDNIQSLSNILFDDNYQPLLNEFVSGLINRIGLTIIENKGTYNNPLRFFKKGSVPLGTDIQSIYENPAEAEQYEYSNTAMAKLLTITDPDTHAVYYRLNRKDLYTKTIPREGLQGAFVSWKAFEDYVEQIIQSLYSGNYIDEFKYTKDLIDGAYENGKIITEVVSNVGTLENDKALVKAARKLFSKMKFPSNKYNAYSKFNTQGKSITTWTNSDRIVFITTSDVLAEIDVEVLAEAFNMSKTDFLGRVVEVDEFEHSEILGVVCDESFIQIYDNLLRFDEFYNARVMAWNEYLHAWGTYAISPFANAVALVTSATPTPGGKQLETLTATIGGETEITLTDGQTEVVGTITPNPVDADYEITSVSVSGGLAEKSSVTNTKTSFTITINEAPTEDSWVNVVAISNGVVVVSESITIKPSTTELTNLAISVGGETEITLTDGQTTISGDITPTPSDAVYEISNVLLGEGLEGKAEASYNNTSFTITITDTITEQGKIMVTGTSNGNLKSSNTINVNPYSG